MRRSGASAGAVRGSCSRGAFVARYCCRKVVAVQSTYPKAASVSARPRSRYQPPPQKKPRREAVLAKPRGLRRAPRRRVDVARGRACDGPPQCVWCPSGASACARRARSSHSSSSSPEAACGGRSSGVTTNPPGRRSQQPLERAPDASSSGRSTWQETTAWPLIGATAAVTGRLVRREQLGGRRPRRRRLRRRRRTCESARARRPRRTAAPARGRARARRSPRRAPSASSGGTTRPVSPSSTISGSPPTSVTIAARPRSAASSATMPKPSPREGTTTIALRSYTSLHGADLAEKRDARREPRRAAAQPRLPSPAISSVRSGSCSRAVANARNRTSNPLIGISRPTRSEPRRVGRRRRLRPRLDAVVHDGEIVDGEPLGRREVAREAVRDRDLRVREARRRTIGRARRSGWRGTR